MHEVGRNGMPHILIIDDEPLVRGSLSELLTLSGYNVSTSSSGNEALKTIKDYTVDLIISDLKMPDLDGLQLLRKVKKINPELPVILMTGYGSIDNAVEAMKEGAYDYVTKPIVDSEIKIVIDRILNQKELQEENKSLKEQLNISQRDHFCDLVGKNEKMAKIYTLIEAISGTRATVLIQGESGTGKHLIAHAIHDCSPLEKTKPFVEVSCGALTETLLESELFGHVKGAFTGAIRDNMGRFERANGGTIFLDEIDAFSPALQVKLLRVIQEGELERVGDNRTIKVDVRIIAATNQSLEELIAQGKFRQDLFYRLNIITIDIPPLRERLDDIPYLVSEFLKKHSRHIKKKVVCASDEALRLLASHNWPGNVRELENVIERAVILSKNSHILPEDLPDFISKNGNGKGASRSDNGSGKLNLKDALRTPEKDLVLKALESCAWNRKEASKILGINRTTLYKKMHKFGLINKENGKK
jgi:two-component system, NtrC family, response regulator HydG